MVEKLMVPLEKGDRAAYSKFLRDGQLLPSSSTSFPIWEKKVNKLLVDGFVGYTIPTDSSPLRCWNLCDTESDESGISDNVFVLSPFRWAVVLIESTC
jgi:hypothetical protein